MKVLIDTNILISALLRDGKPEAVILWIMAHTEWEWFVSPTIMDEYRAVLQRKKFGFAPAFAQQWIDLLDESTVLCEPDISVNFPRDRKDAKFLECAQFIKADLLITGDRDFSEAQSLTDTIIISPSNFAKLFMEQLGWPE